MAENGCCNTSGAASPDYLDIVVRGEVGQSSRDGCDSPAACAYRVDNGLESEL